MGRIKDNKAIICSVGSEIEEMEKKIKGIVGKLAEQELQKAEAIQNLKATKTKIA
jgi:hypothetical protein